MANLLREILPREAKFFPLFDQFAALLEDGAKALKPVLGVGGDDASADTLARVAQQGNTLKREILDHLRHSFVTPFDRPDIKGFAAAAHAALAQMAAVAKARRGLKLGDAAPDLAEVGDLIAKAAGELRRAVPLLEKVDQNADALRSARDTVGDLRASIAERCDDALIRLLAEGGDDAGATLAAVHFVERVGAVGERLDDVADRVDDLVLDHV